MSNCDKEEGKDPVVSVSCVAGLKDPHGSVTGQTEGGHYRAVIRHVEAKREFWIEISNLLVAGSNFIQLATLAWHLFELIQWAPIGTYKCQQE